jgi:hypothetical protein
VPWEELLHYDNGRQLFAQSTHIRLSGGTEFIVPQFCFASLTHLSFSCHGLSTIINPGSASAFDSATFPDLQEIVPSLLYMVSRTQDRDRLRDAGHAIDRRMEVIACPKKWKEVDIWESALSGGKDLWERARSGEYLENA